MTFRLFESDQIASHYARTRPTPPLQLVDCMMTYLEKDLPRKLNGRWANALDVGAGSGQFTFLIGDHFDAVLGTDISAAQIGEANRVNKSSNISFKVSPAESIPLEANSVSLITASECVHWFDLVAFYQEVDRLLVPGGMFAAFGYDPTRCQCKVSGAGTAAGRKLEQVLEDACQTLYDRGYWDREAIDLLLSRYENLVLPYPTSLRQDKLYNSQIYTAKDYVGYIKSLSAFERYAADKPDAARAFVDDIEKKMQDILMQDDLSTAKFEVTFEFFLLMSKKAN